MQIDVITLFPGLVTAIRDYGVVGRALRSERVKLGVTNPREYSRDTNNRVDDRPYGGGPGMIMQYEPMVRAIDETVAKTDTQSTVVYLSPQGKPLDQKAVRSFSEIDHLVLLCGRYEGIDERIIQARVDQEWSIGDYVISGGELAAMILIDAVVRTLPGVLGDEQSAQQDSFERGLLDCPHYTRPERIEGFTVPEELLSGNHKMIARWRLKQMLGRTFLRRADMIEKLSLSEQEHHLLDEYLAEEKEKNER